MHGTTTSVRAPGRFPGAVSASDLDPAWRPWVRVLDLALEAGDDPVWAQAVPEPSRDRVPNAPLLDGVTIVIDAKPVRRLLRTLLREAEVSRAAEDVTRTANALAAASGNRRRLDVLAVLRGAIAQDVEAIEREAHIARVDPAQLATVAQLAVTPLLRTCAAALRDRIPESWLQGYCPVCGAWPALAELRGLERNRRLRCGRCSTDWPIPVLRCPYCDEIHHDKLHAFLPEGDEQTRRVDVCETCKGYLKAFSTLSAMAPRALALADLATVELDLAAQERGYERPARVAYAVSVHLCRAGRPVQ